VVAVSFNGYTGPVQIHLSSLDAGVVYTVADGTYSGINTLNGLSQTTNGVTMRSSTVGSNSSGVEDSFGIIVIDQIIATDGSGAVVYNKATSGFTLAGLIYNSVDVAVTVAGTSQVTSSTGTKIDIYSLPGNNALDLALLDPSGHTAAGVYTGITSGTLELQLAGVVGGLGGVTLTNPGGSAADLQTIYNGPSSTGSGSGFFNVVGGGSAAQFNTNSVSTALGAGTADTSIQFSTSNQAGVDSWYHAPWTVADSDPVNASVIPEPTTALSGLACLMPILGMVTRRRRAVVATPSVA
jgi:hypothetical protein